MLCQMISRGAVLVLLLVPSVALANDSTFGGAPADLVPLAEQQVRMLSEDVVLTAQHDEWHVEARYEFQNLGKSDVKVQVGFPEFRCPSDEGGDCADVAFRDLVTLVDGAPVKHRQGKLTKHGWAEFLGVVWLFDVEFPVGRAIAINHRYRVASGGDVAGNSYTSYVTRTGRSWAGTIGRATFTAVFPPYTRFVSDVVAPGLSVIPPRLVLDAGPPRVELRLEGKDWKPEGGVHFNYNTLSTLTLEPIDVKKLAGKDAFDLFSFDRCPLVEAPADAQACLNDLYASRGYPFKSPPLQRKYYSGNPAFRRASTAPGKVWLRDASPLAAFSTDWFDSRDGLGLKEWTALVDSSPAQAEGAANAPAAGELPLPAPASMLAMASPGAAGAAPSAASLATTPSAVLEERRNQADPVAPSAPTAESAPVTARAPESKPASGGCALLRGEASDESVLGAFTAFATVGGWLLVRARRRWRASAGIRPIC
jgi:hypothetical protein